MESNKISLYSPETSSTDVLQVLLRDKRSLNTRRAYEGDLRKFFQFVANSEPTAALIEQFLGLKRGDAVAIVLEYKAWMMEKKLSEATINRRLSAVRSLIKYARRLDRCEFTLEDVDGEAVEGYRDTSGIPLPMVVRMLEQPDRSTLKGKRDYAILCLLWENALRRGELVKINFQDIDLGACKLKVFGKGKGTQDKPIDLSAEAVQAISEWLEVRPGAVPPDAPIFTALNPGGEGRRLTGEAIRGIVVHYCDRAGIDRTMSPHRIRHSAITAALDATGGDVRKVQKLSRHADIRTLMRYDDNRNKDQKELTNILSNLVKRG